MRHRVFLLLGMSVLLFTSALNAAEMLTVRVTPESLEELAQLSDYADYAVSEIPAHRLGRSYDYLIPNTRVDEFSDLGFRHEIIYPDRAVWNDADYYSYQEIQDLLSTTVAEHPDIAVMENLGVSTRDGVIIWGLKISDNPGIQEDEPDVLLDAVIHAREPVNANILATFINEMTDGYGVDAEITSLIDETEIWIIPILNPEGYIFVQTGIDNPWWRKNKRDNDEDGLFEGVVNEYCGSSYPSFPDGVDLNRNYAEGWFTAGSGAECSIVYRGPAAMSENEAQLQQMLFEREHFVAGISFHSYSEYVGYCGEDVAGIQLAEDMAASIHKEGSGYYTAEYFYGNGQSYNWMYWEHGCQAYLIETATTFFPNGSARIAAIVESNQHGIRTLLDRVHGNGIRGHVYDASTLEPLVADLALSGDPAINHPRRSEEVYGRFARMLEPGSYELTVSLEGYHDQVFENLQVVGGEPIELEVPLYPLSSSVDEQPGRILMLQNYPNPFNPKTNLRYVLAPGSESVQVELSIFDMAGRRIRSFRERSQGGGVHDIEWDGRNDKGVELSSGVYLCTLKAGDWTSSSKMVLAR